VPYIDEVLQVIESILMDMNIEPIRLSNSIRARQIIPLKLGELISESDMGIVILDGLRPNVVYEYALLQKEGLDIIPLKKNDAKLSIKSFYYNSAKRMLDPSLAFGNWHFNKAALKNLQDPFLDVNYHLSDCQGEHIIIFDQIDDSRYSDSLGKLLRIEIEAIIPKLKAKDGLDFQRVNDLYYDLDNDLLNESVRLLSIFSILGWKQNYEDDDRFQSTREAFRQLFSNENVSIQEINAIFEDLLQANSPILRNYGRYITVDSERLVNESFEYYSEHEREFNRILSLILDSEENELKVRFFDRLSTFKTQRAQDLANNIIRRSGTFPDISILQDREKSRLFSKLAYLSPSAALERLEVWFSLVSINEIEQLFPFQSSLISPGNPQDSVLRFLSNIAKFENYFGTSMDILMKFSLPYIVQESRLQDQIHPYVNKLALDRFLEQCHSLIGEVDLNTRWNFIKNIAWDDDWDETYTNATIDLKFRAITTFLDRTWVISGPVINGSISITHYNIEGNTYDKLEHCREEAYRFLLEWLNQPDLYNTDTLFDYFYRNLSDWLKYVPWDKIKIIFENIFKTSSEKKITFICYIDNIRKFGPRQVEFLKEDLLKIFQFQEELEASLTNLDYFKRKLRTSPLIDEPENILNDLLTHYIKLEDSDRNAIIDFFLSENSYILIKFGQKFKNSFSADELKQLIEYCSGYIENNHLEEISEFFIGLWISLFNLSNELWKVLTEEYWHKPHMKNYLYRLLIGTSAQFDDYRWNKYKELVDTQQVNPMDIITTLRLKELPPKIPEEERRKLLIKSFDWIGQLAKLKEHNLDEILEYSINLEALFKRQDSILDVEVAESFLENFYPFAGDLITNLYNTDLILKFGELATDSFKKWIKSGFSVGHQQETGEEFLEKCFEIFPKQSYEILEPLFATSQSSDYQDENQKILYLFSGWGNPKILNHLSEEQIINLYYLNSSMLAPFFGRLIRDSPINSPFPSTLKNLIINHPEDRDFKKKIFQEFFSGGVRTFAGNNYDQQFSGDYMKISNWRDSAKNQIFKDWLRDLHTHIDSLRDESRDFWEELEVE